MKKRINKSKYIILILIIVISIFGINYNEIINKTLGYQNKFYNINDIPAYSNKDYIYINDNKPDFNNEDKIDKTFEQYSNLDSLGRCGVAYANISKELMPTEERKSIGMIKPSGWKLIKYDNISGKYLYNRCHLIAYQLTGENANEKNLITCTRQMNINGMKKFEDEVAKYINETNNHVLYRVTPVFIKNNLLATGVQMEAYSIEDNGEGISFNVFIYNIQNGINIDYSDGSSSSIDF